MTHFRVLYIGQDPDADFAPFNEQEEEYYTAVDKTKSLRADYKTYGKEYRKNGRAKNAVQFAKLWYGIDTVVDKAETDPALVDSILAKHNANKTRHIVANGSRLVKVVDFYNVNGKFDYYNLCENITETFDYESLLKQKEDERREYHRKAVEVLGHIPNFKSFDDILRENYAENNVDVNDEKFLQISDTYWEQPDVKALQQAGVSIYEGARCSEEEFVGNAFLPFDAVVTDKGWFEQVEIGWWATEIGPKMTGKDWRELQLKVIKDALKDKDEFTEVWICDCHI